MSKRRASTERQKKAPMPLGDDTAKKGWLIELRVTEAELTFLQEFAQQVAEDTGATVTIEDVILAMIQELKETSSII